MRNERGITLIALVVTIIVLLILAGVTITYALSDNGIFNKAKDAQKAAETATIRDAVSTAEAEALIEYYDENKATKSTFQSLIETYLTQFESVTATSVSITNGVIAKDAAKTFTVESKKYTHTVTVQNGVVTTIDSVAK